MRWGGGEKKHRSLPVQSAGWCFGTHRGLELSRWQGCSGEHWWDAGACLRGARMKDRRQRWATAHLKINASCHALGSGSKAGPGKASLLGNCSPVPRCRRGPDNCAFFSSFLSLFPLLSCNNWVLSPKLICCWLPERSSAISKRHPVIKPLISTFVAHTAVAEPCSRSHPHPHPIPAPSHAIPIPIPTPSHPIPSLPPSHPIPSLSPSHLVPSPSHPIPIPAQPGKCRSAKTPTHSTRACCCPSRQLP